MVGKLRINRLRLSNGFSPSVQFQKRKYIQYSSAFRTFVW